MNQSNTTPTATPSFHRQTKQSNALSLSELCSSGYWLCLSCEGINTREDDDDHGQPASCNDCGGVRFRNVPAVMPALIEPGDLHD